MLLFDLQDYVPLLGTCPSREDWQDIYQSYNQTKTAYIRSVYEWFNTSTVCLTPSNPCFGPISRQWSIVDGYIREDGKINRHSKAFFESLTKENSSFDKEACANYRKTMVDFRCEFKKLMILVDGDTFDTYRTPS